MKSSKLGDGSFRETKAYFLQKKRKVKIIKECVDVSERRELGRERSSRGEGSQSKTLFDSL